MPDNLSGVDDLAKQRQQAHFQRARRGVMQYLQDKGGSLPMAEMHDFSLKKYLIQHQSFSQLMETLVDEKLVEFNFETNTAILTDVGRTFLAATDQITQK